MKYLFILILVFFEQFIYSQSYEYIKKLDTIYIPFREGKYNVKIDYPKEKNGFKNRCYSFNYKKKDEYSFNFEFDKNRTSENKKVKKSFLRKNKGKIIEIKSLKFFDYYYIQCELFNHNKTFYLIDFSEKKGNIYTIYRVIYMNFCNYGE